MDKGFTVLLKAESVSELKLYGYVSVGLTAIASQLGGWDMSLKILIAFMVMDYVTGVLGAWKGKKVDSDVMFWGGIRKGVTLGVIYMAVLLDHALSDGTPVFRTLAIYYYVAREGVSVTENMAKLNVPLPPAILSALEQLKAKAGGDAKTVEQEVILQKHEDVTTAKAKTTIKGEDVK